MLLPLTVFTMLAYQETTFVAAILYHKTDCGCSFFLKLTDDVKFWSLKNTNNCVSICMLQNDVLQQIQSLVPLIDWKTGMTVWSLFLDLPHTATVPESITATTVEECTCVDFADTIKSELAANELTVTDAASSAVDCKMSSQAFCSDNIEDRHTRNSLQSFEAPVSRENCTADKDVVASHTKKRLHSTDGNMLVTCDNVCDIMEEISIEMVKKDALSFRATCHRTGKDHCFQSPAAAAHFGGTIQDYLGWNVNLSNYDIEVVLCIEDRDVRVGISLTNQSLHRRHITHFGKTTLRPTIAYGMLR